MTGVGSSTTTSSRMVMAIKRGLFLSNNVRTIVVRPTTTSSSTTRMMMNRLTLSSSSSSSSSYYHCCSFSATRSSSSSSWCACTCYCSTSSIFSVTNRSDKRRGSFLWGTQHPKRYISSGSTDIESRQQQQQQQGGDGEQNNHNKQRQRRHRLDVAIVGMPNAGKSQLLNVMTKSPSLAAVSRKRHTTRHGILGVRTFDSPKDPYLHVVGRDSPTKQPHPPTQLIFVDTPGFLKLETAKQEALFRNLVSSAEADVTTSDLSLLVVDSAKRMTPDVLTTYASLMLVACVHHMEQQQLLSKPKIPSVPLAIVLNKVDLVNPKTLLLDLADELGLLAEMCWNKADQIVNGSSSSSSNNKNIDQQIFLKALEYEMRQMEQHGANTSTGENSPSKKEASSPTAQQPISLSQIEKEDLMGFMKISDRDGNYCPVFMISALKDDGGIDDILKFLIQESHEGEWELEAGEVTEMTDKERCAEIIREKIYRAVHKEVPHNVTQVNRQFEYHNVPPKIQLQHQQEQQQASSNQKVVFDDFSKILRISQELHVQTKSHHRILMGKNGSILERIQRQAEREMERVFNCKVFLECNVKVRKNANLRILDDGFVDDSSRF